MNDESDFYSSVRLKGNKINSKKEFIGYIFFRGETPPNVIMDEIPEDIKKPIWDSKENSWIDKGDE